MESMAMALGLASFVFTLGYSMACDFSALLVSSTKLGIKGKLMKLESVEWKNDALIYQ